MPSRRLLACLVWVSLALGFAEASPSAPFVGHPPPRTLWRSPDGLPRPAHAAPPSDLPLVIRRVEDAALPAAPPPPATKGRVCLVVADALYDVIYPDLAVYSQDLVAAGYPSVVYRFASGTAASLRDVLTTLYHEPASLVGAVLIGDIPYIIYEMMDEGAYEDFPCDLYFMDLDGVWSDTLEDGDVHAGNRKYDTRSGDLGLEIWVSRLKTDNLTWVGGEEWVLTNYLRRNHSYRQGLLHPTYRALVYPDDDWHCCGPFSRDWVKGIYCNQAVELTDSPNATTAVDYIAHLQQSYELIHTRSHGYPGGHMYYRQDQTIEDWVFVSDYLNFDPEALFYSFFVCSGADYTAANYLAGAAVFNSQSGLFSWSSTKTGGMWEDGPFYESLAAGNCFGQAFVDWFNIVQQLYPLLTPSWWYGMVLTGDATLPGGSFCDVRPSYWASREIAACHRAGIVGGYLDGSYRPILPVSRDQVAVFVSRALADGDANVPPGPPTPTFSDVPTTHWAYKYIEYAKSQKIVGGYAGGAYQPSLKVDRAQMAVFVARSIVEPHGEEGLSPYTPPPTPTFPDVPISHWAYKHIEYVKSQSIVSGYADGSYRPTSICSRDQMAVYVTRAFHLPM